MAGRAQPEVALGVDLGGVHREVAAVAGPGGDEVEAGEDINGMSQGFGHPAHLAAEFAEDAADLTVFLALENSALGAERGDTGGLDEDGFAGAGSAMDDAVDLVAVIDGDWEDVVVAG